jgi:protein-S-isoprenylcysteine O-methyltransferase Ste14
MKARAEERFLAAELEPEVYSYYRQRVPMLLPFLQRNPEGPCGA